MKNNFNSMSNEELIALYKTRVLSMPKEYKEKLYKIFKIYDTDFIDLEKIKQFISKLNKYEQEELKKNNTLDIQTIINILLKRVSVNNIRSLNKLFDKALTPSIDIGFNPEIQKISKELNVRPELLFNIAMQEKISNCINNRFINDKKIINTISSNIADLLNIIDQRFESTLKNTGDGSIAISNIKTKIQAIQINDVGLEQLVLLQNELITSALSIENEIDNVGKTILSSKSEISILQDKISKLENELEQTKQESSKDDLTKLLNRKAYEKEAKKIESLYSRNHNNYAIVFIDLDNFKNINDTYGHRAGDMILINFAKFIKKETRGLDIIARYGGEEFIAIVNFTINEELIRYLKRIKNIINKNLFLYNEKKIKVTFSAGVAIRNTYTSYENTIQKADILLYEAKNSGKSKIVIEDGVVL